MKHPENMLTHADFDPDIAYLVYIEDCEGSTYEEFRDYHSAWMYIIRESLDDYSRCDDTWVSYQLLTPEQYCELENGGTEIHSGMLGVVVDTSVRPKELAYYSSDGVPSCLSPTERSKVETFSWFAEPSDNTPMDAIQSFCSCHE